MTITLPYPPSLNAYYRKWRNRMVLSEKGRAYEHAVMIRIASTRAARWKKFTEDARLRVESNLWQPDERRRDIDNTQKAILDAIKGRLFVDDSQIDELIVRRMGVDRENPRAVVTIERHG